jgi:hypothetical protein
MMRDVLIFLVAAAVGALSTLAVRSALHQPYAPSAPAAAEDPPHRHPAPVADPHAGHAATPKSAAVNTICAICGMDVDPELPTATFEDRVIAFGCIKCPPKFAKDPGRYGPSFLRNEQAP